MARARRSCVLLSFGALLGCPNPNTYGTPRTVPAAQVQHTIGIDALYVSSRSGGKGSERESSGLPMLPTYQYRRGVTDKVDVAFRVVNVGGLGADVKWNPVRGSIDFAIDPGAQWSFVPSGDGFSVFLLHAPVLVGFNVTSQVTLVLTPGIVYALESGTPPPSRHAVIQSSGVLGRLGVGVNVRLDRHLELMPELTAMRAFNDTEGVIVVAGVGIKHGAQPLMDGETAVPAPPEVPTQPPPESPEP